MIVKILSSVRAVIDSYSQDELDKVRKYLSYQDKSALYLLTRLKKQKWFKENKPEEYQARMAEITKDLNKTLLEFDGSNYFFKPSQIEHIIKDLKIPVIVAEDRTKKLELIPMQWKNPFPHTPYPYQPIVIRALLENRHANAELCTGGGKTYIIMKCATDSGLKTVIVTPSESIWREIYNDMVHFLGIEQVGSFSGEKKDLGKKYTVAISKSVSMVEEGSKEWKFFQSVQYAIFDEAHTLPAEQLALMCNHVLAHVNMRSFLSGTMSDPYGGTLINDIVGKNVFRMTTREGIAGGYLGDVDVTMVGVKSQDPKKKISDPNKCKRFHLYENPNVIKFIASLANASWNARQESTLILVSEIEQIAVLKKLITVPMNYVHGNTIKASELVEYGLTKVDSHLEVEKFNRGESKVLIGTSSISTGTNIYPTHNTVNFQGGASEIQTRQGTIGRSVRKLDQSRFKEFHKPNPRTKIWDFKVADINVIERHAATRTEWYKDVTDNFRSIGI